MNIEYWKGIDREARGSHFYHVRGGRVGNKSSLSLGDEQEDAATLYENCLVSKQHLSTAQVSNAHQHSQGVTLTQSSGMGGGDWNGKQEEQIYQFNNYISVDTH